MIEFNQIPHLSASLNAVASVFLCAGWIFIRKGDQRVHKICMLTAMLASLLFLIVYLYYHANAGLARFGGEGAMRTVYFTILISHVILAMVIMPLIPLALVHAFKKRFKQHKRITRWTLPIWLYVSVSGVIIYIMAIHIYPYPHA